MNHAEDAPRWRLLKALLGDALDQPPEKRQAFIDAATPDDDDLRAELIALAAAASCEHSPLDSPPAELAIDALRSHATTPWIGRQLGPYCLRKLIAGGGMGQVYLAERVDGQYAQRVAIKLMRESFERAALVSRFKAERQILASLDHVNLAKVLDGGITEEGVPYCQAAKEFRSAISMVSRSVAIDHNNMDARSNPVTLNVNLSIALLDQGDVPGSIDAAQASLAGDAQLPEGMRRRNGDRLSYGEAHYHLGRALERRAAGRGPGAAQVRTDLQAACEHFRQSADILQDLNVGAGLAPGDLQSGTARQAMRRCLGVR